MGVVEAQDRFKNSASAEMACQHMHDFQPGGMAFGVEINLIHHICDIFLHWRWVGGGGVSYSPPLRVVTTDV